MFTLFNAIAAIILMVVDMSIGTYPLLYAVYVLAVFLPSLGVTVRRLHDTGRSGWWILIDLVPLVGFIILIVFLATEGNQTDNAHGPNPKLAPAY